jgi:antitoxin component YwqK of YwqJK toxin-antitoxin module
MKAFAQLLLILIVVITACKNNNDSDRIFSFDEKDYKLIDVKKDDLGNKYSEEFVSNKDNNLRLKKIYWENGNIQSITFFSNNKKFGPDRFYDTTGGLLYEGFYYADKETGIIIEYDAQSKKAKIETYKNGNVINQTDLK